MERDMSAWVTIETKRKKSLVIFGNIILILIHGLKLPTSGEPPVTTRSALPLDQKVMSVRDMMATSTTVIFGNTIQAQTHGKKYKAILEKKSREVLRWLSIARPISVREEIMGCSILISGNLIHPVNKSFGPKGRQMMMPATTTNLKQRFNDMMALPLPSEKKFTLPVER